MIKFSDYSPHAQPSNNRRQIAPHNPMSGYMVYGGLPYGQPNMHPSFMGRQHAMQRLPMPGSSFPAQPPLPPAPPLPQQMPQPPLPPGPPPPPTPPPPPAPPAQQQPTPATTPTPAPASKSTPRPKTENKEDKVRLLPMTH